MKTDPSGNGDQLPLARRALNLFAAHLQEGPRGDLEGIDTIAAGLDAMAAALAALYAVPDLGSERPLRLDEVLTYGKAPRALVALALELWEQIRTARYQGLSHAELESAEKVRDKLHKALKLHLDELFAGSTHA